MQPFCGVWVRFLMCLVCSRITSRHPILSIPLTPSGCTQPHHPITYLTPQHPPGERTHGNRQWVHLILSAAFAYEKPPLASLPLEGVSCAGLVSDVYEVDTLTYSVLGNHEGQFTKHQLRI